MSNKKLLSENTIRRFMKLAHVDPLANGFIDKRKDTDALINLQEMVAELGDAAYAKDDALAAEEVGDNATSGIVDDWIDQCEERVWFLNQTTK